MLAASGQVHFMHQGHGHLGAHTRATNTESPPTDSRGARRKHETEVDTEAGMLSGVPESAVYVQIPVGSRNSASRNAYHTSLRPSSLFEPRHPSLKVVSVRKSRASAGTRGTTRMWNSKTPTTGATGLSADHRCPAALERSQRTSRRRPERELTLGCSK